MAVLEFRSPASGGFFMMPTTFQGICEVLERPYAESGCWLPEDLPGVIEKLQTAVDREKDMIEQGKRRERERELKGYPGSNPWPDEEEEKKALEHVTFSMRVYPLLERLRAAQKKGKKVMWGVP